jgi:nitrate/nitrite transporter NarK
MAPTFLGDKNVGPVIAVIALGGGIAQYVGPQVLGILKDITKTYTAGWIYAMFCGLAATLLTIGLKRYFERRGEVGAA